MDKTRESTYILFYVFVCTACFTLLWNVWPIKIKNNHGASYQYIIMYNHVFNLFKHHDFDALKNILSNLPFKIQIQLIHALHEKITKNDTLLFDELVYHILSKKSIYKEQKHFFNFIHNKTDFLIYAACSHELLASAFVKWLKVHDPESLLRVATQVYNIALEKNDPVLFASLIDGEVPLNQDDAVDFIQKTLTCNKHEAFISLLLKMYPHDDLLLRYASEKCTTV